MPIYEFYCDSCHAIFSFLARRPQVKKIPSCPQCGKKLQKQISLFSHIGQSSAETDGMEDLHIDESKIENALASLAGAAENINEDDPKQMASIMRQFSQKSGMNLGDGMEEALCRMEAGEDPEKVEQEMGTILENEDPFACAKKIKRGALQLPPDQDDTLYELDES